MDQPKENLQSVSFFDRPQVQKVEIPIGGGVPLGFEVVSNNRVKSAGVYGAWGESYDNQRLLELIEQRIGRPMADSERMDLAEIGFLSRHHVSGLTLAENNELEIEVGARLLREAAYACGWEPQEVQAVLLGASAPLCGDYVEQAARRAGIPEKAVKVSIHKACDGSMSALHLSLNPALALEGKVSRNLAHELRGKKVLVGGIEALSRFIEFSGDVTALQLFANGAGIAGLIPGETMEFLVGRTHEVFDEAGVLAVRMEYPHAGRSLDGHSNVDIQQVNPNHIRLAGLMNEPANGSSVTMTGRMGMVKLFVRTDSQVVRQVVEDYRALMIEQGRPDRQIDLVAAHHANYKINKLIQKNLHEEGIDLNMPWVISDFGNISAASCMIAYLRLLPQIQPGDHVMFDGFGAGTYYDVLVVEFKG
jgi:3-oxoacyl-[acyl-carrier-protein] synthase III